jgi:hypothetical protein
VALIGSQLLEMFKTVGGVFCADSFPCMIIQTKFFLEETVILSVKDDDDSLLEVSQFFGHCVTNLEESFYEHSKN